MKRIALSALLVLSSACGEPLECTTDQACGDNAYCLETKCRPIALSGQFRQSYREQILPLIQAECNCHGPQGDRPWFFESRPGFVEENDNFRRVEPWIRHRTSPRNKEELAREGGLDALASAPIPLNRFAAGQCGFNHPGIYDPKGPKSRLMELWAREAAAESLRQLPLPEGEEVSLEITPPRGTFVASLPAFERAAFDRASQIAQVEGYDAAMEAEIVPRVVGQCGCCHDRGPYFDIGLEAATEMRSPAERAAKNLQFSTSFIGGKDSETGSIAVVKYGLGSCLGAQGKCDGAAVHPTIYTGPTDPRLLLLLAWVKEGPEDVPDPVVPDPDMGPPGPIPDGGIPEMGPPPDMGPPPAPTAFIETYIETIAPHFETSCALNGGCHAMLAEPQWFHGALGGAENMVTVDTCMTTGSACFNNLEQLAAVVFQGTRGDQRARVSPGDPANSGVITYGDGENHVFHTYGNDDLNRAAVVAWINSLPPTFPIPEIPPDAAPPPMPMDAAPPPESMDAAVPGDMGANLDAGLPPDGAKSPDKK